MAKRRAVMIERDGRRLVHLAAETRVPAEPVPMATVDGDVVRDRAGKAVARDPSLVRWDARAQTHVSYVERDTGPASVQAYRPVIEETVLDDHGRAVPQQRRATGIEYLYRAGDITEAQIQSVRWLADRIEAAQLGAAIQAVDWGRPGGGAFNPAKALGPTGFDASTAARREVREALRGIGWPDSLPARLLVYTIATGQGVLGWQAQAGEDAAKRKHRQYLVGCLVGAVVQLDIWCRSRA